MNRSFLQRLAALEDKHLPKPPRDEPALLYALAEETDEDVVQEWQETEGQKPYNKKINRYMITRYRGSDIVVIYYTLDMAIEWEMLMDAATYKNEETADHDKHLLWDCNERALRNRFASRNGIPLNKYHPSAGFPDSV